MQSAKIKPTRWFYGLAVLIMFIGGVIFAIFLFSNLSRIAKDFIQVVVPGQETIILSEPGKYIIFYEHRSIVGNKVYSTGEHLSGLYCLLKEKSTGQEIPLTPSQMSSSYSSGSRSGVSIFEFSIVRPGTYELKAWYEAEQGKQEVVLAIGHGFSARLMGTIFGGIAIFIGSLITGGIIAVITYTKRQKCKRLLESSAETIQTGH